MNILSIYDRLAAHLAPAAARVLSDILGEMHTEIQTNAKQSNLDRLEVLVQEIASEIKETQVVIHELTEAQKRTEIKVEQLAEAQKRTEIKVEQLAEEVRATQNTVRQLSEEVRATQNAVRQLSEEMRATQNTVRQLSEEVRATQNAVRELTEGLRITRQELGGLAKTVGYQLEDMAYQYLPQLLREQFQIELTTPLKRDFLYDEAGNPIEINILGTGIRQGVNIQIIGESKAQLAKKMVEKFRYKTLLPLNNQFEHIFAIMLCYMTNSPEVFHFAKQRNIHIIKSFELNQYKNKNIK